MNYRHIFHAGNFADVFKHWILTLLLDKLLEKPTPFFVLDTHAGLGEYDLEQSQAQKTLEYNSGIMRILDKVQQPAFQSYFEVITQHRDAGKIYPGSPKIIQHFLRDIDRLCAVELHDEDYSILHNIFREDKRIKTIHQDGYAAIKALLPPSEKRGLIFIDPPFENTNEFALIINALEQGLKRFAHGVYAIWYPIKDNSLIANFYKNMQKLPINKCLAIELHANELILNQLNSCGMLIINPGWGLEETLRENARHLLEYLDFKRGKMNFKLLATK